MSKDHFREFGNAYALGGVDVVQQGRTGREAVVFGLQLNIDPSVVFVAKRLNKFESFLFIKKSPVKWRKANIGKALHQGRHHHIVFR